MRGNVFIYRNLDTSFSEFVFDPSKWPREQVDEDFSKLGKMFNAIKSVVRVPNLDPKYKIAVLASKQVCQPMNNIDSSYIILKK